MDTEMDWCRVTGVMIVYFLGLFIIAALALTPGGGC